MARFGAQIYRSAKEQAAFDKTIAGKYSKLVKKNHFLYLGLPFLLSIVAGSIYLQKFTSIKWERYDEKHQQLGEEEMMDMIENKRKFDKKQDFYRLQGLLTDHLEKEVQQDYEIVRVQRKKEDEPVCFVQGKEPEKTSETEGTREEASGREGTREEASEREGTREEAGETGCTSQ
ncbi:COX16 [Candida oxycetoniae]|uniref:Cytochrome c oxidase assembly protein COX16, mitochondrial n=1 Tax=Candida oxycetoniae TaxID=497107 RepID=A0AAI9T188_9ASCO|nr:COX16 [Candida oxycetoniae]KAI3407018.1 COX16 [Candida oxycetoniae]